MLERYEEAIIYYKRSLENDEDNESSWYSLGSCYYALKNYEDAAKCYEKAIQLKPDRFETYGYLINAHEQLGDYNVALEYAVKLIQLSPDSILPVMCLNAWGYNLSNYPDVLENYLQENEGDLEDVVKGLLYYCLGETTSVKGNNDKAKKAYSKAHTIFKQLSRTKPDYYYSFWGLGSSSYGLSQYGEAIKAYKKAMTLHENPLSTYAKLAFLYSTCPRSQYRDKNNALKFATKACELTNNQNDICLSVLAAACAENGDFENAIKHQQVAIDLADNESKTEYNKRLSEYKLNRPWRK